MEIRETIAQEILRNIDQWLASVAPVAPKPR